MFAMPALWKAPPLTRYWIDALARGGLTPAVIVASTWYGPTSFSVSASSVTPEMLTKGMSYPGKPCCRKPWSMSK